MIRILGLRVKRLVVGRLRTNCYIVECGYGEALVIDPGGSPMTIVREVLKRSLKAPLIVITHGHPDHYSAYREVKNALGSKVVLHEADTWVAERLGLPVEPDMHVDEGSVLKVGASEFKVLYTPGHSPGSISLLGDGLIFTGDTLFRMGYGRTDLPGGSYEALVESIRRLLALDEGLRVYPGHGPWTTIGAERLFYKRLGHEEFL